MKPPIRVSGFGGTVPRTHRRMLADSQATVAENVRLTDGSLGYLREPKAIHTPDRANVVSFFRHALGASECWLTWGVDVDVERGPIADDEIARIYWTGDNEPRMGTFAGLSAGGGPWPAAAGQYVLGVSTPTAAPTLTPAAAGTPETRAYVYTFVTALGEESAPSPPVSGVGDGSGPAWTVNAMQVAPFNSYTISNATHSLGLVTVVVNETRGLRAGETVNISGVTGMTDLNGRRRVVSIVSATQFTVSLTTAQFYTAGGTAAREALHNVTRKRIYRTVSGDSSTTFRFVAEVAAADVSYSDAVPSTTVAAALVLPSDAWVMPPAGMHSLVALPNGIMAGLVGKEVCFSVPFQPHAWPQAYRQTMNFAGVGLGVYGTTVVIPTTGSPYVISGVDPATMGGGAQKIDEAWPCQSKRSIVSTSFGVMFAAPQGIALIGIGGAEIATRDLYTIEEFRLLAPQSFSAAIRDGGYHAAYTGVNATRRLVLMLNKAEYASVTTANVAADRFWLDQLTGILYALIGNVIHQWDHPDSPPMLASWMSKEFVLAAPGNPGAAKIEADFERSIDETTALNAQRNLILTANLALIAADDLLGAVGMSEVNEYEMDGDGLADVPPLATAASLLFELWVNGVVRYSKAVFQNEIFRLPAGYKGEFIQFRVAGNVRITAVAIAGTPIELKGV